MSRNLIEPYEIIGTLGAGGTCVRIRVSRRSSGKRIS
jgi:hypothetical protein